MKKLPIGIQSLSKILANRDYVYVDKTGFAKKLIDEGAPYYFISRPRRFGKSLFLNTLEEIFKGNKELFKGCAIYESDYGWEKHPVVHLDFSKIANHTFEHLETALKVRLEIIAKEHDISIITTDVQVALDTLIVGLSNKYGSRVVVLVDEYDKPIIDRLSDIDTARQNRDLLRGFFGTLKGTDAHLRFTFVTGISKFSQVSLFSGLNNLKDITMDPRYATMVGYTQEQLAFTFQEHIAAMVKRQGKKESEIFAEAKEWYNGYRFSNSDACVYNPFSTLNFMDRQEAEPYWYSSGTPSFLIREVEKHPQSVVPLNGVSAKKSDLMNISSLGKIDLAALMFQTGYLTIQSYNTSTKRHFLGFPNREVKEAFLDSLLGHFATINPTVSSKWQDFLTNQDLTSFCNEMKAMLAAFPYQLFVKATEATYQSVLLGILKEMDFEVEAEQTTNIGRTDLIIEMEHTTYIFELKLNGSPEEALAQIHKRKYFERYTHKKKKIALLGVNFSSESRSISAWKGELLSETGQKLQDL
ncbi:ATP-binding protein [Candidatus Neptunochlamydia vexilliferae]|uniref:AAA-ATPase-like domain-containing protein n=1 Tax=Candidatus Neptunichlamydia vexilliferae TaxID=1651774 RepID=A0ABS0AYG0_9BACT|nr:ATP-binding protein [Candidatus Neptunochlamydia vexilliferae]MBF5059156.1 hypothetical protein [Candidatus Neptunochlamydia vexilliferae]